MRIGVIMHILIDGYNLIRQSADLRHCERQSLEAGRNALIDCLSGYQKRKGHRITIVFDGWNSGPVQEERDIKSGIYIIYSGHGEKADEVIKRLTAKTDEEILVVSSDREIASYAARRGKATLSSAEFETIVNRQSATSAGNRFEAQKDEEESSRPVSKKGQSRRLSRAQRHAKSKIRKL